MLTNAQAEFLDRLDRDPNSSITDENRRAFPGLHFCPEYDGRPICFDSPEIENCLCPKSIAEAIGYTPE